MFITINKQKLTRAQQGRTRRGSRNRENKAAMKSLSAPLGNYKESERSYENDQTEISPHLEENRKAMK